MSGNGSGPRSHCKGEWSDYVAGPPPGVRHWNRAWTEVVPASTSAEYRHDRGGEDLIPLDELIRQTPGAHPIGSVDELRCDAFETEEELEEFLAFVSQSRHADLA